MTPLVVILGPTAVGKSELAVDLALRFGGEIVSADSVQVYKYLNIGTARITPRQKRGVPHHLLGFLEPDKEFTVAQFQHLAREEIEEIGARNRLPFLVGGTGLYIQAVIDPYEFPRSRAWNQFANSFAPGSKQAGSPTSTPNCSASTRRPPGGSTLMTSTVLPGHWRFTT